MEITLAFFCKKLSFQSNGPFGPKNAKSSLLWICSKEFSEILHDKKDREVHGNYIVFSEKFLIMSK